MRKGALERIEPLSQRVLKILIDRINQGIYPPGARFPSQQELADEFQVSRATIRSAVDKLAAQGYLESRQGVGTWVVESALLSRQVNTFRDLPIIFAERGLEPGIQFIEVQEVRPDSKVATALELQPEDTVVRLKAIFYADSVPVMYSTTSFPTAMMGSELTQELLANPEIVEPYFIDFVETRCNQKIKHFVARLRADLLKNCPIAIPPQEQDAVALVFDELCINSEDHPIVHILNYFPSNRIEYTLVRPPGRSDQDQSAISSWRLFM